MITHDIDITGHGFYQIQAVTPAGTQFLQHVQGFADGVAYCESSQLTENIADGAVTEGLTVLVNGLVYDN